MLVAHRLLARPLHHRPPQRPSACALPLCPTLLLRTRMSKGLLDVGDTHREDRADWPHVALVMDEELTVMPLVE